MYNCSNCQFLHHFYPNNSKKPLKDCNEIKFNNLFSLKDSPYKKLIYCRIQEEELNYFTNYNSDFYYDINCGERKETNFKVFRLEKEKYHFFRVKKFLLPKNDTINKKSNFSLVVNCAKPLYNIIYIKILVFIGIESKKENETYMITCSDEMNFKTE